MAHLSDVLLQVAVVVYLAAMTGYLVEYAFGKRGAVARVAGRRDRELVTVGASSSSVSSAAIPADLVPTSPAPAGAGSALATSGSAEPAGSAGSGSPPGSAAPGRTGGAGLVAGGPP